MLCTRDTLARTPLPMYNKTIRVPQLTAAILSCDVIWHKAYCVILHQPHYLGVLEYGLRALTFENEL